MKRVVCFITTVAAVALLAGCLDVAIEVNVSPDGSGTITVNTLASAQTLAQMQMMSGKPLGKKELHNVDQLKRSANNFGKGVKFVSSKYIEKKDGSKGAQAVYSFEDINTVSIQSQAVGGGMGGGQPAGKKDDAGFPWRFKYDKSAKRLTIVGMKKGQKPEPKPVKQDPMIDMKMQQMKMMGKGMKICITVKGKTAIKSTTATHFDKKTNTVTLMLFDIDKIINDDAKLRRLLASDDAGDMADPNMPGVKAQDPTKDAIIQF